MCRSCLSKEQERSCTVALICLPCFGTLSNYSLWFGRRDMCWSRTSDSPKYCSVSCPWPSGMVEIKSIQSLAIHSSCSCTSKDTEQEECSSHSISFSQGWDSEKQKDLDNALQMWVHQAKRITQNWTESKSKQTHLILELSIQVSKAKVKHTLSLRFKQLYILDEETQRVSPSKLSSNKNG